MLRYVIVSRGQQGFRRDRCDSRFPCHFVGIVRNKRTPKKPLAPGVRRVRDDSTFRIQRDAAFSAAAGVSLFNGSPLPAEPLPVNCLINPPSASSYRYFPGG